MSKHYPLNGIDLDFSKYEHRPISYRDVIVNRIMQEYMWPKRVKSFIYEKAFEEDSAFGQIKGRDRELGLDMQVLSKVLKTDYSSSFAGLELRYLYSWPAGALPRPLGYLLLAEPLPIVGKIALGLVERYYLESEPSIRAWLGYLFRSRSSSLAAHQSGWKKDLDRHVKGYESVKRTDYRYSLFSGGHRFRINTVNDLEFYIDPQFVSSRWLSILQYQLFPSTAPAYSHPKSSTRMKHLVNTRCVRRGRPQRSSSLPALHTWNTAALNIQYRVDCEDRWIIYFPRRPLSELDKLSRRRSLSRAHIRAMFTDKPKVFEEPSQKQPKEKPGSLCANCSQDRNHRPSACPMGCGYCNSSAHKAHTCPIKASNRCKCMPFPQYHTCFDCDVNCSRKCGCPSLPGSGHHKNAMLCSYRCCMCGAKGHSGRKCSLKKCPCGGNHLTQDCRWKVECPAKNCNFYLCHLHCRECGKKKDKASKEKFVGRTCQDCLRNGKPVLAKAELGERN
ncbi:uncharacterized protein F4812DRAFT_448013 [Daldinia caldariorum]|uniref:uncharacterized protein n=1 Tax=Daldinia caldariorum TaxID=326644 RepID=UPI0020078D04|nr:uncharacterized protein F4812DRAFT_448013 [Daldinia caldariorum]KAI1463093.1 hypothetical protein F4812DRAFT_448013 [Daldinia caldariorum]